MAYLPVHPSTGLRALGMSKRGPIWPVLGGSEDAPADAPAEPGSEASSPRPYPAETPLAEMAPEQQAAYWKFHARKREDAVRAFGGKTPQQIAELETQLNALKAERMSAEEKAIADAVSQAQEATRAEVEQEWQSKYRTARLQAVAGTVLTDKDQLKSFMSIVDTSKFVGEDGDIDDDAVMGHLTAIYGQPREFGSGLPQHRNWGQHSAPPPMAQPGAAGRAEAARRRGEHTT
ncbi:hypothetical protein ACWDSF_06305 [Nocardia beijingensis]